MSMNANMKKMGRNLARIANQKGGKSAPSKKK